MSGDTVALVPRGVARKKSPELPDVPEELRGFSERLVLAREMLGEKPSKFGTSRLERGIRVRRMAALTAVRIAEQMGVRVAWLLIGEEPMWMPGRDPRLPHNAASVCFEEIEE